MTGDFGGLGYALVAYVLGGAGLLLILKVSASVLELLPINREQLDGLRRVAPLLGTVLVVGYCLLVVRSLFRQQPGLLPIALALILAGFIAAAWGPLRDVVTGVFLKVGKVCSPGDTVQVGEVSGRVTHMGHRALSVETASGKEVVVPYAVVAAGAVSRVPVLSGAQAHVFELTVEPNASVADTVKKLQKTALRHHWSSSVRVPEVKLLEGRVCRVTVYPLTLDYAAEIEEELRREFSA